MRTEHEAGGEAKAGGGGRGEGDKVTWQRGRGQEGWVTFSQDVRAMKAEEDSSGNVVVVDSCSGALGKGEMAGEEGDKALTGGEETRKGEGLNRDGPGSKNTCSPPLLPPF
jgi:hypothetical protein